MIKNILGIEYSCDDTSIGVVSSTKEVLVYKTISQYHKHGVIPEIAARNHLSALSDLVSDIDFREIDAIATTFGPGLVSSLMTGVNFSKGLSLRYNLPLYKVNHLEAHILSVELTHDIQYPFLSLLVSGGHSQLVLVKSIYEFVILGATIDDALGECFDKVAKSMNLDYPGGPMIEKYAVLGNKSAYKYTKPKVPNCNLSFSGLKTQVIRSITEDNHYDVAASFNYTIESILVNKVKEAIQGLECKIYGFSICGGVAANKFIRNALQNLCNQYDLNFYPVDSRYCMDNGPMIAWTGFRQKRIADISDGVF